MMRQAVSFPKHMRTVPTGKIAVHNNAEHHRAQMSEENGFRV
jgi:hypothetical protein